MQAVSVSRFMINIAVHVTPVSIKQTALAFLYCRAEPFALQSRNLLRKLHTNPPQFYPPHRI